LNECALNIGGFAARLDDMFEDRRVVRGEKAGWQWSVTIWLLVINALVCVYQYKILPLTHPEFPFEETFALSLDGLRAGHWWQLLTYQFLHGGFWHLFFNSWAIFVFGPPVEAILGKGRMLFLYLMSGVMGGLVQMLCSWLWPNHFGILGVVGASAGAFGLVAAFGVLFPRQQLVMLLFFVIPIKMKARTLVWVSIAMAVLGMIVPYGNIGHAAHLGGVLTGMIFAAVSSRAMRPPPIVGPSGSYRVNPATD
jgi:membrane associated rhomboid family serine protease